jgi:hypothetical protein
VLICNSDSNPVSFLIPNSEFLCFCILGIRLTQGEIIATILMLGGITLFVFVSRRKKPLKVEVV